MCTVYRLTEVVRPIAQRLGEWVSGSRVTAFTDLLFVIKRKVPRTLVFNI